MNRSDFIRLMKGTHPGGRQMTGEINELIGLFPYFQSAHMLLLKTLQESSDIRFESQLKSSAIHITDREVLYHLLSREHPAEPAPVAEPEAYAEPAPVAEPESYTEPAPFAEPEPFTAEPVEPVTETVITDSGDFTASPAGEDASADIEGDSEQTVIESALNSEDLISEIEREEGETHPKEMPAGNEMTFSRPILISAEIYDDDAEWDNTVFIIEDEPPAHEETVIYMDPGFSVAEHFDLLELAGETEEPAGPEACPSAPVAPVEEQKQLTKQLHADLIDRFILTNPRIEPPKEKSDQPAEDISKPFTEEQGGFVTETLARIYVNQGYYSKAIEIYEKLSLKFPEKSSYFAAQIEKVKELIK